MKKKKILFVATEFAAGMIPFAATIINTLAADNHFEIHCICVCSERHTYRGLISCAAHPIFIDYPKCIFLKILYKLWPFAIIKQVKKVQREINPDAIHYLTGDFTMANYIQCYDNVKVCYTVHDMHPHEVKLTSLFERLIFRLITRGYRVLRERCMNLTTSSRSQLKELKDLYPDKNIEFTPFPTLMNPEIEHGGMGVKEIHDEDKYLLFFGGVQEYKGVQLLIDAFNRSSLSHDIKLVIAGRGIVLSHLNQRIIRINRFIDDRELKALFLGAEAVIYPYLSATMSGVLSLAYYFKKRVILSDIPFFQENKTSACTFFRAGEIDDLTSKLNTLEDISYDSNNDNGYQQIYSTNALVDAYYVFYEKINS